MDNSNYNSNSNLTGWSLFTAVKNSIATLLTGLWRRSNPPEVVAMERPTSSSGTRYDSTYTALISAFDIFGIASDYLSSVVDCKKLSEQNPVFVGITDKVVGPVADAETYIKVDKVQGRANHPKRAMIEDQLNKLVTRIQWNESKEEYYRNLLNEGGLSLEVIAGNDGTIENAEYRPHYSIEPQLVKGKIVNPDDAYHQIDITTRTIEAQFAKWQIAEINWKNSTFHTRGIPYFASSRRIMSSVGDMLNGVVSKWMRSGGELEVYTLKTATGWDDVEKFKQNNAGELSPNARKLVRQIFTTGDMNVQRLHGDNIQDNTAAIEFLLELIFLSTGVSKEIAGFKGHVVLKDMASISLDSYYRLLNRLQNRGHAILKRIIDTQMLLQFGKFTVLPEELEYEIVGGYFSSEMTEQKVNTTVKVVELLVNQLMANVENRQDVLDQIVGILTYDLKEYGISFKNKLMVAKVIPPAVGAPNVGGMQ